MTCVREIRTVYDNFANLKTQILAASIRNVLHVKQAAMIGADVVTVRQRCCGPWSAIR